MLNKSQEYPPKKSNQNPSDAQLALAVGSRSSHALYKSPRSPINPKSAFALVALLSQLKGAVADQYYFADAGETIYKLWTGGVDDMSSVIKALKNYTCSTNTTSIVPKDLITLKQYDDHGGTAPLYSAILYRDANGTTNNTVVDCVTELVNAAHQTWLSKLYSPEGIIAIAFIVLLMGALTGAAVYCCSKKEQPPVIMVESDNESDNEEDVEKPLNNPGLSA